MYTVENIPGQYHAASEISACRYSTVFLNILQLQYVASWTNTPIVSLALARRRGTTETLGSYTP
eukprot:6209401-Pleurochrysis_carterae.AAC.3